MRRRRFMKSMTWLVGLWVACCLASAGCGDTDSGTASTAPTSAENQAKLDAANKATADAAAEAAKKK